jgi:hypothetical protein
MPDSKVSMLWLVYKSTLHSKGKLLVKYNAEEFVLEVP